MASIFPDNRREQYLEKPLPSSEESERVILGAILLDNEVIHQASAYLTDEMFYSPLNRRVYAAMVKIAYGNISIKHIDPIGIGEILKMEGSLDSIGGITAITNLTFGLPHFSNIESYIQNVKGKYLIRSRIRTCNAITSECLAEEDTPDVTLNRTELMFMDHVETSGHTVVTETATMEEAATAFNRKVLDWKRGKSTSLPSPFPLVNKFLNERGYSYGDLSIVAGRPSDGKTTFGVQNAFSIARHYQPTLIISLEQAKEEIFQKILAGEAQVPNYRINEDLFMSEHERDKRDVERLAQAELRIKDIPCHIDDQSVTLSSIMATSMDHVMKNGVRFIFIDYGQIIINDLSNKRDQTRDRELGEIAERLKNFAKKETKTKPKVHVQLALQLKRIKAAPTMDDLRESGSYEQIADLVLAPWGEKPKDETVIREMTLYCLKQRKGRRDWQLPISFHGDWQRFYDRQMMDDSQAQVTQSLLTLESPEF